MAVGPGRYDELCTYVREQSQALAAVVIVVDGNKGSGFSVQTFTPLNLIVLLEQVVKDLRAGLDDGNI